MAKQCFSAVRAGRASNSKVPAWNVAAEIGETEEVPQSLIGVILYLTRDPLWSLEACGHQSLFE